MKSVRIDQFIEYDLIVTDIQTCFEKKCPTNWVYDEKNGRNSQGIVLVLGGSATYQRESDSFNAMKDDIVFLRKGSKYKTLGDSHDPYYFCVISFSLSDDKLLDGISIKNVFRPTNPHAYHTLFHDMCRLWFYKGIAYKIKCRAILQEILYLTIRESIQDEMHSNNYSKIQPAASYMERYFNTDISLKDLASMASVSEPHFRRIFKETYKVSPIEYLNYLRVEKSKDLLLSNMYSITEIAEKTGFTSIYYFSRVFKKYTGISPAHYSNNI